MGQSNEAPDNVSHHLAVYGSLAPGQSNHHVVADIRGTWTQGTVEGVLHERGWGAAHGYPGIVLKPGADRVPVHVLESHDRPDHWPRLDRFEGAHYRRTVVAVQLANGRTVHAHIYAIRDLPDCSE